MQEPLIYRLVEAMQHYGCAIKHLVNEKKGDGIISAIDLYMDLDVVKGKQGEDRVVVTLNGKFLPHIEQVSCGIIWFLILKISILYKLLQLNTGCSS